MSHIIEVAVPVPLYKTFDYLCDFSPKIGVRVKVPFGRKSLIGIVFGHKKVSDFQPLKSVSEVLDDAPILSAEILQLLTWTANYYHHPLGEVIATAMPYNLRVGKPAVIKKTPDIPSKIKQPKWSMTTEQVAAVEAILKSQNHYQSFLLQGITGSGKTEIYLQLTKACLLAGQQVLVLVPEIGLTPQMIGRFSERLKVAVVAIHSKLNRTQKLDAYLLAKSGAAGVVLGTRSAIFTPFANLGMIIIDEEQDGSFKQNSGLRYHAKSLGFMRAKNADIPLVLGTATPSLEILKNVIDAKTTKLILAKRAGGATLPTVNLIDMRPLAGEVLAADLVAKMGEYLQKNQQVMLFINRRGYAPIYFCRACGWRATCNHCDAALVYHHSINRLNCHHCNASIVPMRACEDCGEQTMQVLGFGTQRLEEVLLSHFQDTPIIRIDRDTTGSKKAFDGYLAKIHSGEPCIMVGTQMLAKGHDFPNLAMVGVLSADVGLLSLDFRATENLSQLLIQVSGRAGRSNKLGEVIIQTHYPAHPIFEFVQKSQYNKFANVLLDQRSKANMPPFSHQALLCANAKIEKNAEGFLTEVADFLGKIEIDEVEIWGPVPGVITKKADYYYFNLYFQSPNRAALHRIITTFQNHLDTFKLKSKTRWYLDIDPFE